MSNSNQQFSPCGECTSPDVCCRGGACGREMLAQADAIQKLAAFGAAVLRGCRIPEPSGMDGGELQDLAEEHGVIVRREVDEPCCEGCACAGAGVGFPTDCFFIPDEIFVLVNKD